METQKIKIAEDWIDAFRLPEPGNMMEFHENREMVFRKQGTAMAQAIYEAIESHTGKPITESKILDFGCGVGRVALPLYHNFQKPDKCVDVDPDVVAYVASQIPGANPQTTAFDPPLPFADDSFDVIFSVSVWTHLNAESAEAWLAEMVRVLRPGGYAFLTTSNYKVLELRRKAPAMVRLGWGEVTDEMLREKGFIFLETPPTPGTGQYGMASHDPDFIRRDWARHFEVVDIISGGILGVQDINVLRKPTGK